MKFIEFIDKYKDQPDIDHIIDYLKSNNYQSRDIRFNYAEAKIKAKEWQNNQIAKGVNLSCGKCHTVLALKKGFSIVRLLDNQAKKYEGFHMRHCVGSYVNHQGIYSLRDKLDIPHCTIEVIDKTIIQIKGKANGNISPEYLNFIFTFMKNSKFQLHHSFNDFSRLGYIKLEEPFLSFFANNFQLDKTITIDNKVYLSGYHKIKIINQFTTCDEKIFIRLCKYPELSPESIELLIKNGVNLQAKDNLAIRLACDSGNIGLVKRLESLGCDLQSSDGIGLSWAAESNRISMVKYLLTKNIQINQSHHDPLLIAIRKRHTNLIKFLLDNYKTTAKKYEINEYVKTYIIDPELKKIILNKI